MDTNINVDSLDAEALRLRREIVEMEIRRNRKREILKAANANYHKAECDRVRALRNGGFDAIADRDAFALKKQAAAARFTIQRLDCELAERRLALDEIQAKAKAERRAAHREGIERAIASRGDPNHKQAIGLAFAIAKAVADREHTLANSLVARLDEVRPGWRDAP